MIFPSLAWIFFFHMIYWNLLDFFHNFVVLTTCKWEITYLYKHKNQDSFIFQLCFGNWTKFYYKILLDCFILALSLYDYLIHIIYMYITLYTQLTEGIICSFVSPSISTILIPSSATVLILILKLNQLWYRESFGDLWYFHHQVIYNNDCDI